MSLKVWLESCGKVEIGGKEVHIAPLPISRLRKVAEYLGEKTEAKFVDLIRSQQLNPNAMRFVSELLSSLDVSEIVYNLLTTSKDPDTGETINGWLTKDWLEEYLDAPAVKRIYIEFVKINELEEILKNLQSLPVARRLLENLTSTFGIALLSSLQPNMDSTPLPSVDSQYHRSMDTSEPTIAGSESRTDSTKVKEVIQ